MTESSIICSATTGRTPVFVNRIRTYLGTPATAVESRTEAVAHRRILDCVRRFPVCRQKANALDSLTGDRQITEFKVLKNAEYLPGWMQVWSLAAAPDIDPCELERSCIIEEASSGSLLPIISMMQATGALK